MKLAFYPFTMPLTLGPGAIAVTTAIGTSMNFTIPNVIGAFAAALANALIVWLCFRYADRITEICNRTHFLIYFGVFRCADFLDGFLRIVADSSIVRAKINRT